MYTTYCVNQPNAALKLQECLKKYPEFGSTLKICETDERCGGLTLLSFLIKPIQRICKYPLFFRELLKHLPPEDESRQTVQKTLSKIEEVTTYINEGKRLAEKLQRIVDIQASISNSNLDLVTISRRFIREGRMMVASNSNDFQESFIFLFNDLFLITKAKKKGYDLRGQVPLEDAKIVDIADTEEILNAFETSVGKNRYVLSAPSRDEKNSWLKELKAIKKEFQKKKLKESM